MVKESQSIRGKSDKHQAHQKKYAYQHTEAKLDRWYTKVTTPKPMKEKDPKVVLNVVNVNVSEEDLARAKEIKECIAAYERDLRETAVFKRKLVFIRKHKRKH